MKSISAQLFLGAMVVTGMAALYGCATDGTQPAATTPQEGIQTIRQTREAIKENARALSQSTKDQASTEKGAVLQSVEDLKAEGEAIKKDAAEIKDIIKGGAK